VAIQLPISFTEFCEGKDVPNAQAAIRTPTVSPEDVVYELLCVLDDRTRLLRIVKTMSEEIQRLKEDNLQLHAAVKVYREVARQHLDGKSEP
jgi:hypothetical protein